MSSSTSLTIKKIIINADDFGMSKEVNRGIKLGILKGVITSTSAIVNLSEFEDASLFLKKNTQVGRGVHLNLTEGSPVSSWQKIYSLVDKDGQFFPCRFFFGKYFGGKLKKNIWKLKLKIK